MPIDPGEALLAAGGLARVIAGEPPDAEQARRSVSLEEELKDVVKGYLRGKRGRAPKVDDRDLVAELPEDAHNAMGSLQGDMGVSYGLAAGRALEYLRNLTPQRQLPGLRARVSSPNEAERAAKRRALQVLEDPVATLSDLAAISDDQVQALQAVYPSLYSALGLATTEAAAEVNRDLTNREERALGRILGIQTADVSSLQEMYQQQDAPQQTQGGASHNAGLQSPDGTTDAQRVQQT